MKLLTKIIKLVHLPNSDVRLCFAYKFYKRINFIIISSNIIIYICVTFQYLLLLIFRFKHVFDL